MGIKFEQKIDAPPSQVYRAFTRSTALREWMCDVALADERPGGRLYLGWNVGYYVSGEFVELEPDERVVFAWHGRDEPGKTEVQVSLEPLEDGTLMRLRHTGLGDGEAWAGIAEQYEREWERGLENLVSVLETGQDIRYVLRPMVGILVGEFNAEVAEELGVPVQEGIRLDGVVEGMGAEAAGLQEDDVIVEIAGAEITGWSTLTTALQTHRAGDKVEVVFYRGAEKKRVTMELSRRPLPEVPETPQAFAEALRQTYEEMDAELEGFLAEISEEEAAYRPGPDQWSVKETLAHLIVGERGLHSWIADLINDDERWSDRWENPTAVPARLRATAAAYPTLPALLEALQRTEQETLALLAGLPPEFVARKGTYTRLAYGLLEMPDYHVRQHLAQMREAVEAARSEAT